MNRRCHAGELQQVSDTVRLYCETVPLSTGRRSQQSMNHGRYELNDEDEPNHVGWQIGECSQSGVPKRSDAMQVIVASL